MKISYFEENIGIETFFTDHKGIHGKLRTNPEDFIVNEIFLYPKKVDNGCFTIAEISSKNWETHRLVRELSKRLKISQKRICFAGTKDKRAYSNQLMSFNNVSEDELSSVKIKDVTLGGVYRSDKPIRLGSLLGNKFEITVRNIQKTIRSEQIDMIASCLERYGGFPNFYGVQRFGVIRPITHIVGRHIINGDFESAVIDYIANPIKGEDEETYRLRENLHCSRDFSKALQLYPDVLNFEKAMLNRLVVAPDDFVGALRELPKNLLLMFVNAYQSFLFNKMLSVRIQKNIPLNEAVIGDIVTPLRRNATDDQYITTTKGNIEKVNKQIKKNKAVVTGLLLGYDSVFSKGEMGEIEQAVIEREKIDYRDFIIPKIPFLSSRGTRRAVLGVLNRIDWKLHKDTLHSDKQALTLKFELQKGCYATSLLREFMKSENPRDY
jgi:tRNA pseudouridine13 synthase